MRIEINLAPGKKPGKRAGPGFQIPDIKELLASVKDPLLIGAIGAWVVAAAVLAVMFMTQQRTTSRLVEEQAQVEREFNRFRRTAAQKDHLQLLRDSIGIEMDAIREIDRDRYIWPHIMTDVSMALPQFAWLTEVRPQGGGAEALGDTVAPGLQVLIGGETANVEAFTRFLRALSESPWLTNVVDGPLRRSTDAQGTTIWLFSVTATFQQADASLIQTAPVADWVQE
jgi:Tfp pilus assembly protein PilN